jgi:hypothetical protein
MWKQELVPQEQSFVGLIAKGQPPLGIRVEQGKDLNKDAVASLAKSGFFVIRGFLSRDLCVQDAIAELSRTGVAVPKAANHFSRPSDE